MAQLLSVRLMGYCSGPTSRHRCSDSARARCPVADLKTGTTARRIHCLNKKPSVLISCGAPYPSSSSGGCRERLKSGRRSPYFLLAITRSFSRI
jgi:hypothetical protein